MAEKDILRIMISTDNHLGVHEHDPVRGEDSFVAFEEVLRKAVEMDADMVLLGGDLFHDNKPSRNTIVKAMRILKKYCLNDRPVPFQVLSDQAKNFPTVGKVNYEDENLNVGLPVFTIHGNHDDPSGTGRLSAVDILSECSLVNYFGNMELQGSAMGRLKISPILLQKGNTYVALYGFGNIRDERLARLFKTPGSVEWERPALDEGDSEDKWYNIFVVHQNRVKHNPKNHLDEASLPPFLDFVLWGHEHQCIPTTSFSTQAETEILQAGSTVATSLSEGEADPKHCFLLEVNQSQFRIQKHALETVRPFNYQQLSLRAERGLDPDDSKGVETTLERKVEEMITAAMAAAPHACQDPQRSADLKLPLVRLKVDYTGFSTVNVQRFGQKFLKKVANPQDILLFAKQTQRRTQQAEQAHSADLGMLRPEQLDQTRIEDLVTENLGPGEPLEVLVEEELRSALHEFVDKDEKHALDSCVKKNLERLQSDVEGSLSQAKTSIGNDDVGDIIRAHSTKPSMSSQDRKPVSHHSQQVPGAAGTAAGHHSQSTPQQSQVPTQAPKPAVKSSASKMRPPSGQQSLQGFLSGSQRRTGATQASGSAAVAKKGNNFQTTQQSRRGQRQRTRKRALSPDSDEDVSGTSSDIDGVESDDGPASPINNNTRSQMSGGSARKRGRYPARTPGNSRTPVQQSEQASEEDDDVVIVDSDEEERRPRARSRTSQAAGLPSSSAPRSSWGAMR